MTNGTETPVDFNEPSKPKPKPHNIGDLFAARKSRGPVIHEPTGLRELDRFTRGGPTYGSTIFVIGAPDASKTLLLWIIAVAYARRGTIVGFHAIDEEPEDLLTRLVQMTSVEIPTSDGEIIERHFTREQFENANDDDTLETMMLAVGEKPIVIYDDRWTIEEAAADLADRGKMLGKKPAFFVDSLQTAECKNVRQSEREVTERRAVTENARAVRQAAIRHHMITMATSESNREWSRGMATGTNPSAMTAGAESRAVEFRARVVIALSPCPGDDNVIQVDIPKNKLGRKAEPAFWLGIDRDTQTLFEVAKPEPPSKPAGPSAKQRAYRQSLDVQRQEKAERKRQDDVERAAEMARKESDRHAREYDALRAALAARPEGIAECDLLTELRARLGTCGDKAGRAIVARGCLAGCLESRPGNKGAKLHFLKEGAR